MNAHNHPAVSSHHVGSPRGKCGPSVETGRATCFDPEKLLEDARRFEREPTELGQVEYLLNIVDNLLAARPNDFSEECLRDFRSSLECTLENLEEDARWIGAARVEL